MRAAPRIAAMLAALLALAGCAASDDAPTLDDAPVSGADFNPRDRSELAAGGELVWPVGEIPAQLNPLHAESTGGTSRLWNWFNPQLILMTPEGEAYPNPAYLSEWSSEIADDRRVLTITFQPEATWNDGTPMTWESIRLTWLAQNGEDSDYAARTTDGYAKIASVEQGATPRTAVVTFEDEYPWVDGLFWEILHPDIDTAEAFNTAYRDDPHPEWGAGPFSIESLEDGTMTLVPNDLWWGDPPLLDHVTFEELDPVAALNAFRSGELDAVRTDTGNHLAQVADMDGVTTHRAQRVETSLLQLNADQSALSDPTVRRAIMTAIDRDAVAQAVWDGLPFAEETPGSLLLYSFQEGYADSLAAAGWEHDSRRSENMLRDAGWEIGADGYRYRDGEHLSLTMPIFGSDPSVETRARALQLQLASVGVELVLEQRRQDEFAEVFTSREWGAVAVSVTSSDPYGTAWLCQLYCQASTLNLSGTGTDSIDRRIAEVLALPTKEQQTHAGIVLEADILAETWALLPLYSGPEIWTVRSGLANLTPEPYAGLDLFGVQPVENVGWESG